MFIKRLKFWKLVLPIPRRLQSGLLMVRRRTPVHQSKLIRLYSLYLKIRILKNLNKYNNRLRIIEGLIRFLRARKVRSWKELRGMRLDDYRMLQNRTLATTSYY
uniref:Putative secreted protein n=1 Tax=Xenopsylla cheopis TaxID=163159 RepID=A0A6M2DZ32_XENCH